MKIIEVIPLTKIPLPYPQILTYFTNKISVKWGNLIMAPLGKRKVPAIVLNSRPLDDEKMNIRKAGYQLSPVKEILSAKPIISPKQMKLAFWMYEYYYEPLGLILKTMLPKNPKQITPLNSSSEGNTTTTPPLIKRSWKRFKNESINQTILCQFDLQNSANYFQKEIEKTLKNDKQILILAPEINTVNKLTNLRPGRYNNIRDVNADITSKTPSKQFRDIWQKTAQGEIKIIFGTRKALFLPFHDLGLIVLAEEHSPHYKSWDQHPKYHSRETAAKLAELHNAKLIMQSEIPNIETKYKMQNAKIKMTKKNEKLSHEIKIIDMREEIKNGNYSIFSRELLEEIKKAAAENKKIILFINRRGEASAILCRDCGYIVKCNDCEAPMVLHATYNLKPKTHNLICHHCGYKKQTPDFCPNCRGHRIKFLGGGTEKVEEELRKIFPEEKISRLDSDTAKTGKEKQKIMKNFTCRKPAIFIGTQLLTTVDLPKADFLGVINSDAMLNMPDFRSGERTFQIIVSLLSKIKNNGKVIYQTYSPEHYAIKNALKNDYENFYKEEVKLRELFNYPPFSQIIKLTFAHKNKNIAEQEAKRLYEKLTIYNSQFTADNEQKIDNKAYTQHPYKPENVGMLSIIGPAPAFIPKKKGEYGWQIILKLKTHNLKFKNELLRLIPSNWEIDVDPENLL